MGAPVPAPAAAAALPAKAQAPRYKHVAVNEDQREREYQQQVQRTIGRSARFAERRRGIGGFFKKLGKGVLNFAKEASGFNDVMALGKMAKGMVSKKGASMAAAGGAAVAAAGAAGAAGGLAKKARKAAKRAAKEAAAGMEDGGAGPDGEAMSGMSADAMADMLEADMYPQPKPTPVYSGPSMSYGTGYDFVISGNIPAPAGQVDVSYRGAMYARRQALYSSQPSHLDGWRPRLPERVGYPLGGRKPNLLWNVAAYKRGARIEDCVTCIFVWLQTEMDIGRARNQDLILRAFKRNCQESQQAEIFFPACQDMYDVMDDLITDYSSGLAPYQLCEKNHICVAA